MNYGISTDNFTNFEQVSLRLPNILETKLNNNINSPRKLKRLIKKLNKYLKALEKTQDERDIFKIELQIKKIKLEIEDYESSLT